MPAISATTVQKTYKEGVLTIFARFSSTGAAGVQQTIYANGASKGIRIGDTLTTAGLIAEATTGLYTLTLDPSIKVTSVLGAPVISYIDPSTTGGAGTARVTRTNTENISTNSGNAASLLFYVASDTGAAAYFPAGTTITVTLTVCTSTVF